MNDFFGSRNINEAAARIRTLLSMPHVRAYTNVAQAIANATQVTIVYGTEAWDDESEYNSATGILTANRGGRIHVTAAMLFAESSAWAATEFAVLQVFKNGALYSRLDRATDFSGASIFVSLSGSDTVEVAAGDTLKIVVYQSSGVQQNLHNDASYNYVAFDRLF